MPQITVNGKDKATKLRKGSLERNLWVLAQNMGLLLPASTTHIDLSYQHMQHSGTLQLRGNYLTGAQWQVDMQPEAWLFYRATPPRLAALIISAACMQKLHYQNMLHDLEALYEVNP